MKKSPSYVKKLITHKMDLADLWKIFWVVPLPRMQSWQMKVGWLGFPTKHETILVVTSTGKGGQPKRYFGVVDCFW